MLTSPAPTLQTGDAERPGLARARQLVSAPWLKRLLAGHPVADRPAPGWQLFEVVEGAVPDTGRGHIPGARWLDVQRIDQAPLWNQVNEARLLAQLHALRTRIAIDAGI